jgi:hypothetical protein
MAAPVYSFPLLPVADVVACLAELGVAVSEAQLAKPEPEHVFKVFEELVTSLVGVSRCARAIGRPHSAPGPSAGGGASGRAPAVAHP